MARPLDGPHARYQGSRNPSLQYLCAYHYNGRANQISLLVSSTADKVAGFLGYNRLKDHQKQIIEGKRCFCHSSHALWEILVLHNYNYDEIYHEEPLLLMLVQSQHKSSPHFSASLSCNFNQLHSKCTSYAS